MSEDRSLTICGPGTIVGATVSAIVYTTLTTTGEIAANATGAGIELASNAIAFGTEYVAGSIAAETIRSFGKTYGAVAKPAIINTSRLGALGLSFLAGTGAAVTTSALIYGGQCAGLYLNSCIELAQQKLANANYKTAIASQIQHPVEFDNNVILLEDDVQLIEEIDKNSKAENLSKHSPQVL